MKKASENPEYAKMRNGDVIVSKQHEADVPLFVCIFPTGWYMYGYYFISEQPKLYKSWSCQKDCDALNYLLDNIFIRFGSKLYRHIGDSSKGTNCAPLVTDCFVMREITCCLFLTIIHLVLLMLLTLPQDI